MLVQDLTDLCVTNEKELVDLKLKGDELRMVVETKFNSQSSRSHTVFQNQHLTRGLKRSDYAQRQPIILGKHRCPGRL